MAKDNQMVCATCGTVNLPGTLFCKGCGTYLASGGPLRTEMLDTELPATPLSDAPPVKDTASRVLSIEAEVLSTGRKVLLPVDAEILMGRLDAARGIFPELDLTLDNGLEMGVSRQHARLYASKGVCYVEDLGGDNGTFLNGSLLSPHAAFRVQDGDILVLGLLQIKLHVYTVRHESEGA